MIVDQMEITKIIKQYFLDVLEKGSFGFSLGEIALLIISLILAILIRQLFAQILVKKIKNIVKRTGNKIDDQLFDSLAPPLKLLPLLLVFMLTSILIDTDSKLVFIIEKINRTFVTIFIFWLLHQALFLITYAFQRLEVLISKTLIIWLTRSLKYLVIFLGIVAVLETWGVKIGPVIAGLGLFGVAVALGAQQLFKNLISGIIIILERRFQLGDVIEVPGHAIGTVEHMGFRSTLIRQFDTTSISLPNYIFSDSAILNYSHRKHRRIKWIIGLNYDTSTIQLKKICQEIENYIRENKDFIVSDECQLFVRVDKFNDSSIDILLYSFTHTNDWSKYLVIKEELAYSIKNIVNANQSSFAFPSQSIYIEKK